MDREQILVEIRRITVKNGGEVPGHRKFENETGVKVHEWSGRYWARWSEAIKEAGLEPNRKNIAYNEIFLMEKLVLLIREIGHFPVFSELKLKASKNPDFPSEKTYRRFGGKQQLVAKVLNFCRSHEEYSDVIVFCEAVLEDVTPDKVSDKVRFEIGFVYLGKSGKHYKIGRSVAPGQRERQLALLLPEKFVELHRIATDDPGGIEEYWHKRFDAKRTNGEFFALNSADVSAFKRRKFM